MKPRSFARFTSDPEGPHRRSDRPARRACRPGPLALALAALCLAPAACTAGEDTTEGDPNRDAGEGADTADSSGAGDLGDAGDDAGGPDLGANDDASDDAGGDGVGGPPAPCDDDVPTDAAALEAYLADGGYTDFAAETAPHESAGPHFGRVRTFVGDCLATSLDGPGGQHPVGAAGVKELYGSDGASVAGWAVMVKVSPGEDAEGWYWYERFGGSTYADGVDVGLCTGCHDAGRHGIRTRWPLQ